MTCAIVTGSSSGIGRAIARRLARAGKDLVLSGRSSDGLEETRRRLEGTTSHVETVVGDLQAESTRARLMEASELLGGADTLINNAAVWPCVAMPEMRAADIVDTVSTNLLAPILLTAAILPGMLGRRSGSIVNIASLPAKQGLKYNAVYSATKAGLLQWSNGLSADLAGTGVRVSSILPTFVSDAGMSARHGATCPVLVSPITTDDVAAAVCAALRRPARERILGRLPVRPLLALALFVPALAQPLVRVLGVDALHRRVAEAQAAGRTG